MLLSATSVSFRYPAAVLPLRHPDLTLASGDSVMLCGPSGSGKTTFLKILAGILPVQQGEIQLLGHAWHTLSESSRRAVRLEKLGMVFQDFALFDYLTAEENILLPLRLEGRLNATFRQQNLHRMEHLDISRYQHTLTRHLSHGEKQRVTLLRALAHGPRLILADEPTSALDPALAQRVWDLLEQEVTQRECSLLACTHEAAPLPLWLRRLQLQPQA